MCNLHTLVFCVTATATATAVVYLFQTKISTFFPFQHPSALNYKQCYLILNFFVCFHLYFTALQPSLILFILHYYALYFSSGMYQNLKQQQQQSIHISFEMSESIAIIYDKLHVNALLILI